MYRPPGAVVGMVQNIVYRPARRPIVVPNGQRLIGGESARVGQVPRPNTRFL